MARFSYTKVISYGGEDYAAIPGFPDYYVSEKGEVLSWKMGQRRGCQPIILKQSQLGNYTAVTMYNEPNKGIRKRVHSLVLMAWIGMPKKGQECCHNDGNGKNNNLNNLRWDSRKNNHADKKLHGTNICGEQQHIAKLSDDIVKNIRTNYKWRDKECGIKALAKKYNVGLATIREALYGVTWKHLNFICPPLKSRQYLVA